MSDPSYKALLIGNSTFPSDAHNLQSLEGPVNDISVLRDALTDPEVGLFDATAVRLLPERTMAEILIELETFFASANRDDRLFLYYSGHGLLTDENRLLLCARDTRTDVVKATTVSATAINDMIDSSAAQTTMIVLDCCYSGAFKGANLPDSLKGNGRYLLTSCRSGQLANDATRRNGTSQFTQHLVDGLLNAVPDTNGDGYVELGEIYDYVHGRLAAEGRQIPQRSFSGGGGVAVARRPQALVADEVRPASEFELSQATVEIDDVEPGETLPPEQVYVLTAPGQTCDFSVSTESDWLDVEAHEGYFSVALRPGPGTNRANVVVRDRLTGATRTLRVRVRVREAEEKAVLSEAASGGGGAGGVRPVAPGPERPSERSGGPERPSERSGGPERPSERSVDPDENDASPATAMAAPAAAGDTRLRARLGRMRKRNPVVFWVSFVVVGLSILLTVSGVVSGIVEAIKGEPTTSTDSSVGSGPADLINPTGVAVDAAGAVYVGDQGHARVRRIGPDGQVMTVAGYGGDDPVPAVTGGDQATATNIGPPTAVAVDGSQNLFVVTSSQNGIFKVTVDGRISAVPINAPGEVPMVSAVTVAPDGALVVAVNQQVFRLDAAGTPTLVAGAGPMGDSGDGGPATAARLSTVGGLAVDAQGALYISDTGNHRVRMVRPDGTIVTVAGTGTDGLSGDGGPAVAADLSSPYGLVVDDQGSLFIATDNLVRKVSSNGTISRVAGSPTADGGFSGDDGPAGQALLQDVVGIGLGPDGSLYVSDYGNNRVRRISADGIITTVG